MLPDDEGLPERYQGRPLLLILENYVLAAIGELPEDRRERMSLFVQTAFGGDGDWMQAVRHKLQLGDSLDAELQMVWQKNRALAQEHGLVLEAEHFAQLLVDENFTPLITRIEES